MPSTLIVLPVETAPMIKLEPDRQATDLRASADSPAPSSAGSDDALEALRKLGELHDAGVLTDEEFSSNKAEILKRV